MPRKRTRTDPPSLIDEDLSEAAVAAITPTSLYKEFILQARDLIIQAATVCESRDQ